MLDEPPSDGRALVLAVELAPALVPVPPVDVVEPLACADPDDGPRADALDAPVRGLEGSPPSGDEQPAKISSVHATHRATARRLQRRIMVPASAVGR
jgi:hypothetical protein